MAEKLLDDAEVGAAFEHVRREAVAQRVRVQPLDAHEGAGLCHERMHALARQATAAVVEEHGGRRDARAHELRAPRLEVLGQHGRRRAHDGHDALLVALAHDPEHLLVEHDLAQVETAQLRDAQAAAVQHLDDRVVALAGGRGGERLVEQVGRLLAADDVGEAVGLLGQGQVRRGMRDGDALGDHEAVEALDGRHGALDARDGQAALAQAAHVLLDALARDLVGPRDALALEPGEVAAQVSAIGEHRVARAAALDGHVVEVLLECAREVQENCPHDSRGMTRSQQNGRIAPSCRPRRFQCSVSSIHDARSICKPRNISGGRAGRPAGLPYSEALTSWRSTPS